MVEFSTKSDALNESELLSNALLHLDFLRKIHKTGVTLQTLSSKLVDRYLKVWLPLVANSNATNNVDDDTIQFIPPSDVAWLWHCHRLAPLRYQAYCNKEFGKIVEAPEPFCFQHDTDQQGTEEILTQKSWDLNYPDQPFFLQETKDDGGEKEDKNRDVQEVDGFDLLGSATRQSMFLWQVSQPRFEDVAFLQEGVEKYAQFLALESESTKFLLVPTYQIDIIWHTHILSSITNYLKDCQKIRGKVFDHDDSLDDRTPGASLEVSFQQTCRLWKKVYGEEYFVQGGMFRGNPPPEFFEPTWDAGASQTVQEVSSAMEGTLKHPTKEEDTTSKTSGADAENMAPWKAPDETEKTFIPAFPRSPVKGFNANPMVSGYVFGKGPKGVGYYSLETKESFDILHKRLKKRERKLSTELMLSKCCLCCVSSKTTKKKKNWSRLWN